MVDGILTKKGAVYRLAVNVQTVNTRNDSLDVESAPLHQSPDDDSIIRSELQQLPPAPNKNRVDRSSLRDADRTSSRAAEEDIEESNEDDMQSPVINQPTTYSLRSVLGKRLKKKSTSDEPICAGRQVSLHAGPIRLCSLKGCLTVSMLNLSSDERSWSKEKSSGIHSIICVNTTSPANQAPNIVRIECTE